MNIDSQIVALLKKENPDMYQYFINRINEEKQPKVYVTKFKKISRYTTVEKLQELEDLGFEELHKLFLEKCEYYGNSKGYMSQWLYIPEMMHVLASLFYDKPNLHPLNLQQMKDHWDATKAKKRATASKKVVMDMFVDDE